MKYNPKLNDQIASLGGFANIHPLQDDESVQGALEVMFELQQWLGEATGLPGVGLAPLAGAQGEYAGLLIARAALDMRGESHRNIALIPDSAHGTNPASAAMAGLSVVTVKTDEFGNVDVDDLRAKADENTCVFMLTIPSTLGLFEPNIIEINNIIHEAGGLVYADGANLNALLGLVKLGDLGIDICHSNLHKTFSTPHGGGGPGAGPVMVKEELASFLPEPVVTHNSTTSSSSETKDRSTQFSLSRPENSIGKDQRFPRVILDLGARLHLHAIPRWRRITRGLGKRHHQCQLHPSTSARPFRSRGGPCLYARNSAQRQAPSRSRRPRTQHRQTTTRLRHSRAHDVLPPYCARGFDG